MTEPQAGPPPELSVIIPAYNASTTLETQLRALLAQRPSWPWEVLVCDNGSTDDTREIVRRWSRTMPELRLVDASARRGPSAARNIGVAHARSPLLGFCDADDQIGPGWVEVLHSALLVHDFVAGPFEVTLLNEPSRFSVTWTAQTEGLTVKPTLRGFVTAGSGNMGVRKDIFEQVGGFDEGAHTAEDDDFCLRVQLAGHELVFVPDLVLHVRQRSGLRQVCRQAYAYGVGARWLAKRYAYLAEHEGPAPAPQAAASAASGHEEPSAGPARGPAGKLLDRAAGVARMARRMLRKVLRLGNPEDVADVAWRIFWSLGRWLPRRSA